MCGLLAFFSAHGAAAAQRDAIAAALESHAPPRPGRDRRRGRRRPTSVFAHKRLAIIDVAFSHEPLPVRRTGRYLLTFNGEIYNYIELREELIRELRRRVRHRRATAR